MSAAEQNSLLRWLLVCQRLGRNVNTAMHEDNFMHSFQFIKYKVQVYVDTYVHSCGLAIWPCLYMYR